MPVWLWAQGAPLSSGRPATVSSAVVTPRTHLCRSDCWYLYHFTAARVGRVVDAEISCDARTFDEPPQRS